jgi:hypothetical protein
MNYSQDMYGRDATSNKAKSSDDVITINVNDRQATVDFNSLVSLLKPIHHFTKLKFISLQTVDCPGDEALQQTILATLTRLHKNLLPI